MRGTLGRRTLLMMGRLTQFMYLSIHPQGCTVPTGARVRVAEIIFGLGWNIWRIKRLQYRPNSQPNSSCGAQEMSVVLGVKARVTKCGKAKRTWGQECGPHES